MHEEIEKNAQEKAAELVAFALELHKKYGEADDKIFAAELSEFAVKTIKRFQKRASAVEDHLALDLLHNIHSLQTDNEMTPKNTADCIMTMISKYHFDTKDILKF